MAFSHKCQNKKKKIQCHQTQTTTAPPTGHRRMLQLEENFKSSTNSASLPPGNTAQEEGLGDSASKQYHIIIHNISILWKFHQQQFCKNDYWYFHDNINTMSPFSYVDIASKYL